MKQFYLIVSLMFASFLLSAQISITNSNVFSEGESINQKKLFDIDGSFDVGTDGENVVWDFSNQVEDGTSEQFDYIEETGLPYADEMNIVEFAEQVNSGTNGYFYFNTDAGTSWERSGWYANEGGTIMWVEYTDLAGTEQPLELIQYPFTYNDNFSSNFAGLGGYDLSGTADELQIELGSYSFDCDAWGKLILPHKVYENALRVHVTESFTLKLMMMGTPVISSQIQDDAYYWFVEGVKGPVMSYVVSSTDGSPNYSAKWHRPDYTAIEAVDFVADMTTGNTDDTFSFTNLSEPLNQGSTFEWVFTPSTVTYMEGTDANSVHPKVKFDDAGMYTAELIITNSSFATSTATETKVDYIDIEAAPELLVEFSADNQMVSAGSMVNITNMTVPDASGGTSYLWNLAPASGWHFDMFTDATSENPIITFDSDGCYAIQLTATNASFSNSPVTETRMQYFNVGGVAGCPVWVEVEELQKKEFSIYPNPAKDVLNINSENAVKAAIIDITGKTLYVTSESNQTHSIDVSKFQKGIYFVNIIDNNTVITKKVVLK